MSFDYLISGITHSTPVTLTVALQIMGCVLAAGEIFFFFNVLSVLLYFIIIIIIIKIIL